MADQIEISIDVQIHAGIAFWVDRAAWLAASDDEKRDRINTVVDEIAFELSNDVVPFKLGSLSAAIIGPDKANIDLGQVEVYDPDE